MISAARKAGRGLARDFGEVSELQVSRKGPADFVSIADTKAEKVLQEALSKARPGYGFLGEECGLIEGTDKTHTWIVDPLDGTTNFLHGIPHFAVNVALERDGQIVAGVTFNPATGELFWAERGKGAFVNDKRLRVAARKKLEDSLVATGIPFAGKPGHGQFLKELHQVSARVAGRFDAYWERGIKSWDIAAGVLLVTEAGGVTSAPDGQPLKLDDGAILAANLDLHPQLVERLNAAG
jgi:myo-inositol-1(or 4)-monophosphatase